MPFFSGPDEWHPDGLVADLHWIAELGDANGLRLLPGIAPARHGTANSDEGAGRKLAGIQGRAAHVSRTALTVQRRRRHAERRHATLSSYNEYRAPTKVLERISNETRKASLPKTAAESLLESELRSQRSVSWYDARHGWHKCRRRAMARSLENNRGDRRRRRSRDPAVRPIVPFLTYDQAKRQVT